MAGLTFDPDRYRAWALERAAIRSAGQPARNMLFTLVVTDGDADPVGLKATLSSLCRQDYRNIEVLVLADDAAETVERDAFDRLRALTYVRGRAGMELLTHADCDSLWRGDYLVFAVVGTTFDQDCFALMNAALSEDPAAEIDMLVVDHDWCDPADGSIMPGFLPGWDPEFAKASDCYSHGFVASRRLVQRMQDASEPVNHHDWIRQIAALEKQPSVRHLSEPVIHLSGAGPTLSPWSPETDFPWGEPQGRATPTLAVIVSCRSSLSMLKRCMEVFRDPISLRLEIIAILPATKEKGTRAHRDYLCDTFDAKILEKPPFLNHARAVNSAVQAARSEVILLLEDTVEFEEASQVEQLIRHALRPGVGAVGSTLCRPDGPVDQAGLAVVPGAQGSSGVGRILSGAESSGRNRFYPIDVVRSCHALSGVCQMMRREVFERVGGWDEVNFPLLHGDVDFCLKLRVEGLRILNVPLAGVTLHGSENDRSDAYVPSLARVSDLAQRALRARWPVPAAPGGPWIDVVEKARGQFPWELIGRDDKQPPNRHEMPAESPDRQAPSDRLRWFVRHPKKALLRALGRRPEVAKTKPTDHPLCAETHWRLQPGIGIYGHFLSEIGLGQAARKIVNAADATRLPISVHNLALPENRQNEREFLTKLDICRSRVANLLVLDLLGVGRWQEMLAPGRYNILFPYWELPRVPDRCKAQISGFDEIWAPTRFIENGMREAFDGPVHLVPQPVQLPLELPAERENRNEMRVFTYFDFDSFGARKNPKAAVSAFQQAFPPTFSDVELIIKVRGRNDGGLRPWLLEAAKRDKRIRLIDRTLSREAIDRLMADCDVFVSLHRSEGFGFGAAEALSAGKVVVSTDFGGTTDFISAQTGFPVPYDLRPVQPGEYVEPEGQMWADASVEAAAICLRNIFDSPEDAREKAARGFALLRANHAPEKVGALMRERLAALCLI